MEDFATYKKIIINKPYNLFSLSSSDITAVIQRIRFSLISYRCGAEVRVNYMYVHMFRLQFLR